MLVLNFFIFGTASIFIKNKNEFFFSYNDLLIWLIILSVIFTVFAMLIYNLLGKFTSRFHNIQKYFLACLYALTFCFFIQGNFFQNNYGTLNGQAINWADYRFSTILSLIVWISVFALLIFTMKKNAKTTISVCNFLLSVIFILHVTIVIHTEITAQKEEEKTYTLSTEGEFIISSKNNTIVFLLDCFDSSVFSNLLKDETNNIQQIFENFTFYKNMSGGATRTKYAIPYIFTGVTNTEPVSYADYLKENYADSPFFKILRNNDIDARIFSESMYISMAETDSIDNIHSGKPKITSKLGLTLHFCKLTAFKYIIAPLKKFFWMYSDDFNRWKDNSGEYGSYSIDDVHFYNEMKKSFSANLKKDAFRFYHLMGPHAPYTMSENCERIPVTEGSEERQALGSLKICKEFIDRLKENGIYANSTIFIMADHGCGGIEQNPLFLLKERGSHKSFSISDVPATYKDMVNMYCDAVQNKRIDIENRYSHENEERFCYVQSEKNGKLDLIEYSSFGHASDISSYKATGVVYHGNTDKFLNEYKIGDLLDFTTIGNGNLYCISGFSKNEASHTWTDGYKAAMKLNLHNCHEDLILKMKYTVFQYNQEVGIFVNGHEVARYNANNETKEIFIPRSYIENNQILLEFDFPNANSPKNLGTSGDARLMTLAMHEMKFLSVQDSKQALDVRSLIKPYSSGFYNFESEFVWSNKKASLFLANKKISKKGLQFSLNIPTQIQKQTPELRIYINDILCKKMNTTPGKLELYFSPEEISSFDDTYDIRIEHDFSFVPKEHGINDDTRELSLQVSYIGEKK